METPQVTAWPLEPGLLSEGPRWDEDRRELLWVDILGRGFHRATLTADGLPDRVRTMALDRHVGAVTVAFDGTSPAESDGIWEHFVVQGPFSEPPPR